MIFGIIQDRICEIHYHTIKNKKVECKKAQPKEAILASTTTALLAAKRSVLLNGLGVGHMPPGHVAQLGAPNAQLGAAQQFVAAQAAQVPIIFSFFLWYNSNIWEGEWGGGRGEG